MSKPIQSPEKLQLTFRAQAQQPVQPDKRSYWPLWCLLGAIMGVSAWYLGQHVLTEQLGHKVAEAEERDDALIALAGLASLGDSALEPVVETLTHQDDKIARAAFRVLDQHITNWQTKPDEATEQFLTLAALLDALPEHTLPTRLQLASGLATRIVAYTDTSDNASLQRANTLAVDFISRAADAQFQPTEGLLAANQTSKVDTLTTGQANDPPAQVPPPLSQNRLAASPAMPAPSGVEMQFGSTQYTDPESIASTPPLTAEAIPQQPRASFQLVPRSQIAPQLAGGSIATGGSASTRVLQETGSYQLTDNASFSGTPENVRLQSTPIQRITKTVDLAAIPSYSVDQLVRLLASTQPQVAQTAALALRNQGMNSERLALASRFAVGSSEDKLALMHDIVSGDEVNPRPWLLWMAEDRDPVVRRQAVSLLHSMVDERVESQLRDLLFVESDAGVADTIRKVLAMRSSTPLR